ncbi:aminodeoxychorismate/anthranilate synthase component II [Patescibacteria group bacterium]|nr:aminodeoxychorismate/anthranilate synthase component II [Patescibacteria group bacterium]MBU1703188.1 aminodeoxychorismate/anthranilate synthase component II [Patescibacteria group bacterium]MBU1953528.1 aminodeoxychorismate/anthranilate synthase component II [Patescibacteria group bacterium]
MKTLIIDNYDSFTYNLFQYVGELGGNPVVELSDSPVLAKPDAIMDTITPTHIIISPGPGTVENPRDFGFCEDIILGLMDKIPILGVCLGHQGIAKAFGAKIISSPEIMHGKQSRIIHTPTSTGLFTGIPSPFTAMRYHSLCISPENFPADLQITARTEDKTIMAIQHKKLPIYGIQFHPESFGTDSGKKILANFLAI